MKRFARLLDALTFRTQCPLCQERLRLNCRECINDYNIYDCTAKQRIALNLSSNSDDILYIDLVSENIELVLGSDESKMRLGNLSSAFAGGTSKSAFYAYNGTFGHALTIVCDQCSMYSYTLQIWADLEKCRLTNVLLNSEMVSWEDEDNVLHEIVSSFSTNNTKYSYYSPDSAKDDGQMILPFISVDVANPRDAVSRIKKLLVFS